MDPQSIIDRLEPLREPAPVSWWPPAPGWWVLAAVLIVAGVLLARWLLRRARRKAPLRAARRELGHLRTLSLAPEETATQVAVLLRRTAGAVHPGPTSTAAVGAAWAAHLNQLAGDAEPQLGSDLATLAYQPAVTPADAERALAACDAWLGHVERCA